MRTRLVISTLVAGALLAAGPAVVQTAASAASPCGEERGVDVDADFDGDGVGDVAHGEPSRRIGGVAQAGAVVVEQSCAPDVVLTTAAIGSPAPAAYSRFGS